MKSTRMFALLLAVLMTVALFAGCGPTGSGDQTTPTPDTTSTPGTTPAPETTTPEPVSLDGYEFELGSPKGLNPANHEGTAKADELVAIYQEIEDLLDCKILFTEPNTDAEGLANYVLGGIKGSDFINVRQFVWIPISVTGGIRVLNSPETLGAGLELFNEDVFNQYYTKMAELNGDIYGLDVSGKYYQMAFGHVYAFNKRLVEQAGYPAETLFQAVRDGKWEYDLFLEIARQITDDTDGDQIYDVWGVALDTDGNEIWTNGTGPIIQDANGKWVANLSDPKIIKSMDFMKGISGDPQVQMPLEGEAVPSRGDRRRVFYAGNAGFAGLYGPNFGAGGTWDMADPVGLLPIPKGPDVDHYRLNMVDTDSFVTLSSNSDWEKSVKVMTEIGRRTYDAAEYREFIEESLQNDAGSIEMLFDYLLPHAMMNIAKPSREVYEFVRKDFYDAIYKGNVSAAAAAETYAGRLQAELDSIFRQ